MAQGGNERWIYEVCHSLDRQRFEVGVLCGKRYAENNSGAINFYNFYYHKLKDLKTVALYEYLDAYVKPTFFHLGVHKAKRAYNKIFRGGRNKISRKITDLIESHDVLCVLDFYAYNILKDYFERHDETDFFILLHTHKAQVDFDPYATFDKEKRYNFAYFAEKQIKELGESGVDTARNNLFYAPLLLDLSDYPNLFNPLAGDGAVVISMFTRVTTTKPIEPFIQSFGQIQKQSKCAVKLNIYGEILDAEYHKHLKKLASASGVANDSIRFMGHAHDIAETIKRDAINIYWGSTNNAVLGYSSIEVGALGVPCIFYDLDDAIDFTRAGATDEAIPVYNRINDFVGCNLKYIENGERLDELSKKQRAYIIAKHNTEGRIGELEDFIISLRKRA